MSSKRKNEIAHILNTRGFEMKELIGKGGFGQCYVVYSTKYDQDFVCKVQDGESGREDLSAIVDSYEKELSSLKNVYHPNVLKIYDAFIESNAFFIIEEYCPGGSLDKLAKPSGIQEMDKLEKYVLSIIDALSYLHSLNIAHHDIKPANVFLDDYGRARLGDFGLSKSYKSKDSKSTSFQGSLAYASPELLEFKPYDPFKADVWSFGVMVYQLATGNTPFKGRDKHEIKHAILSACYDLPQIQSQTLLKIIIACLRRDPITRPTFRDLHNFFPKTFSIKSRTATRSVPSSLLILSKSFSKVSKEKPQKVMRLHSKECLLPPLHRKSTDKADDALNSRHINRRLSCV